MALVIALATLIGLLLGLLGGGGSILTVPVLVYLVDQTPKEAIVTSLIVVGLTSAIAVLGYARRGLVCWRTGTVFGVAGAAGAFLGGRLAGFLPGQILMVLFGVVMLGAAAAMLGGSRRASRGRASTISPCAVSLPVTAILFDGVAVGLITGLVGVGGGFLLVPALSLLTGLTMHAAVGTSLFIITLQSAAALAGHASHMAMDPELAATVTVFAVLGSFAGGYLAHRLSAAYLKRGFGAFVLGLSGFVLYREVDAGLMHDLRVFIATYREFFMGAGAALLGLSIYRLWHRLHADRNGGSLKGKT